MRKITLLRQFNEFISLLDGCYRNTRFYEAREFVTTFAWNQPGAQVAFKVFVILTTDNEAGSAPLLVERPFSLSLAA